MLALSVFNCPILGQARATISTPIIIPVPSATNAISEPNSDTANPDSKLPSSFDTPMKILFTAEMRPRILSEVYRW